MAYVKKTAYDFWYVYFLDDVSKPQVLVVVESAPNNQLLREEIRRTWGHACITNHESWCSLVFILGQLKNPLDSLQHELKQEHEQYGDILQDSFIDSYNNLTIKSIHVLKYFNSVCNQIGNKFLLKTDDDSFIHLEGLWRVLKYRAPIIYFFVGRFLSRHKQRFFHLLNGCLNGTFPSRN